MSSEIKEVIGLLCKQLNFILSTNLKPEYFRLAKFDKSDENVIPILWTTLSLLTTKENPPDITTVKNHMKSLNYTAELFYNLPEDYSSGSRELLMAIVFIIAKNLPELINEEIKRSPFDESHSILDLDSINVDKPKIPDTIEEKDIKNYILWLKGKIRQNSKMTEEYEAQIAKMYEKLNSLLNNKATGNLTLNEVLALSSKKYATEFVEKTSRVVDLLQYHQEWRRKEKIFWKWMNTVLMERHNPRQKQ